MKYGRIIIVLLVLIPNLVLGWDSWPEARSTHSYLVREFLSHFPEAVCYQNDLIVGCNSEIHDLAIEPKIISKYRIYGIDAEQRRNYYGGTNPGCQFPERIWQDSVDAYKRGDKGAAYFFLGVLLHHICDMGVPSHAYGILHGYGANKLMQILRSDPFEKVSFAHWMPFRIENFPSPILENPSQYYEFSRSQTIADIKEVGLNYSKLSDFPSILVFFSSKQLKLFCMREGKTAHISKYTLESAIKQFHLYKTKEFIKQVAQDMERQLKSSLPQTPSALVCELTDIQGDWDFETRQYIKDDIRGSLSMLMMRVSQVEEFYNKLITLDPDGKNPLESPLNHLSEDDLLLLFSVMDSYYEVVCKVQKHTSQYGDLVFHALAEMYKNIPKEHWQEVTETLSQDIQKARNILKILFISRYCASQELRELYKEKFALLEEEPWKNMSRKMDDLENRLNQLKDIKIQGYRYPVIVKKYGQQKQEFSPVVPASANVVLSSEESLQEDITQEISTLEQSIYPLKIQAKQIFADSTGLVYFIKENAQFRINSESKAFFQFTPKKDSGCLSIDTNKKIIAGTGTLEACIEDPISGEIQKYTVVSENYFQFEFNQDLQYAKQYLVQAEKNSKFWQKYLYTNKLVSEKKTFYATIQTESPSIEQILPAQQIIQKMEQAPGTWVCLSFAKKSPTTSPILCNSAMELSSCYLTQDEFVLYGKLLLKLGCGLENVYFSADNTVAILDENIYACGITSPQDVSLGFARMRDVVCNFSLEESNRLIMHQARGVLELPSIHGLIIKDMQFNQEGILESIQIQHCFARDAEHSSVPFVSGVPIFIREIRAEIKDLHQQSPGKIKIFYQVEKSDPSLWDIKKMQMTLDLDALKIEGLGSDVTILSQPIQGELQLKVAPEKISGLCQFPLTLPVGLLLTQATLGMDNNDSFIKLNYQTELTMPIAQNILSELKIFSQAAYNVPLSMNISADLKGIIKQNALQKEPSIDILFQCKGQASPLFINLNYTSHELKNNKLLVKLGIWGKFEEVEVEATEDHECLQNAQTVIRALEL